MRDVRTSIKERKKESFFYVIIHYKALLIDLQADGISTLHIDFVYNNRRLRRENRIKKHKNTQPKVFGFWLFTYLYVPLHAVSILDNGN